ncbi:MAG: hypothetical protein J1G38_02960 [Clostridiales bacterium]|nr:hypothetical protein [Clostridiales bacterium]
MEKKDILDISGKTFLRLPFVDTSIALRVRDIDDIAAVKSKLEKLYGGDFTVTVDGKAQKVCDISEAAVIEADALPDFDKARYNVIDAERVIERLMRKPDGCPWDSVQTHESIRINMIEEAYEAVDAIDSHDLDNMQEEFGDVLLQSLLQSAIARREGEFDFDDVCDGLCKKLIGRHTFIFGSDSATSADDALKLWDKNKSVEKHYNNVKTQLENMPKAFPSLLRCQKAHKKIKKAGGVVNPEADLKTALKNNDYAQAICACAALLSDEGKDAEVELNKIVRDKIEKL